MLIGYEITTGVYASFALMLLFIALERKTLYKLLKDHINRYSAAAFAIILLFFLVLSIVWVSPVEQLYFDENIYQGVAINILKNGDALWCQYGTGYLTNCYINSLYHDPVGWSAFIAIAFEIFGIGTNTAYGLELMSGAASILLVFLLSSILVKRKSYAVVSTLAFALMPQLFIWSRTQADVDLAFMMFATLSFFLFVSFVRKKNLNLLAAFAFSLDLVSYMRIEAMLLVGVFAILLLTFSEKGVVNTIRERVKTIINAIRNNTAALVILLAFTLLLLPQLYYVVIEAENPSYGQGAGQSVISLTNFENNIGTNVQFVFGQINGVNFYPTAFHYAITPLAILGGVILALYRKIRDRFGILLLLMLWFAAYFFFYTAFYAGSATFGVDSRFMLQLLPAVCMLAAFAIIGIGDIVRSLVSSDMGKIAFGCAVALLAIVLLIYPFSVLLPAVTIAPNAMPQQHVILSAMTTFYGNYSSVPQNCLVFTFTPDIWFEVNRSAAQVGYINGANATMKQSFSAYSCLVFDYGYWCVVPPYHNTLCAYSLGKYQVKNIAPKQAPLGGNETAFYQILNYS